MPRQIYEIIFFETGKSFFDLFLRKCHNFFWNLVRNFFFKRIKSFFVYGFLLIQRSGASSPQSGGIDHPRSTLNSFTNKHSPVQISKCICPNCKMYLLEEQNVFAQSITLDLHQTASQTNTSHIKILLFPVHSLTHSFRQFVNFTAICD